MGSKNGCSSNWKVFHGSLAHSTNQQHLLALDNRLLGILNGKVIFLEDASKIALLQQQYGFSSENVYCMKNSEFLVPGLIDTHIHAPQYANVGGVGIGEPLLDWLQKYTYPTEANCEDLKYARDIFRKAVKRTLTNGTTTAVYYATIHLAASLKLCDIIEEEGQRAFVGKVNIDCNSPDWYCESTKSSMDDTRTFIENVLNRKNPLLTPILTPRFALCCTEDLMRSLGQLAQTHNLPIQTHISENKEEVRLVGSCYPHCDNYADVYEKSDLLTDKTILAHGVHLTDEELELIKLKGTKISHCPTSNISLVSGLCDVRRILEKKIPVGLGTDVSGGYSPSILDAMRQAMSTSTIVGMSKPKGYKVIDYREAFYLATLGGAQVIGMEKELGNLEVGKQFDALLIDADEGPIDSFPNDDLHKRIQRFIYLGDDRNIKKIFVAGNQVK